MGNRLEGIVSVSDTGHIIAFAGDAYLRSFLVPEHGFIDHVYLNDRIAVLTFFDALRRSGYAEPVLFRLQNQGVVSSSCRLAAHKAAHGGRLELALVMEQSAVLPELGDKRQLRRNIPVLGAIAHDMRTPLNAIIGFSEFLLQEVSTQFENDRQRDYVALIQKSGKHLLQMVNTMLAEADATACAEKQRMTMGCILSDCIGMMAGFLRQRQFTGNFEQAALCRVALGDVYMRRIVINLLSNAVKYTADNGVIALQAGIAGDGRFVLSVKDNGIGISRGQLALIGAPFHRAGNAVACSVEGSGLGLALVYGIVESCGGEIKIKSRQGRGTVVRVFLPLVKDDVMMHQSGSCETVLQEKQITGLFSDTVSIGKSAA